MANNQELINIQRDMLGMIGEANEKIACLEMICKIAMNEIIRARPDPHSYLDVLSPGILGIAEKLGEVSTPATQKFLEAFVASLERDVGPRKDD